MNAPLLSPLVAIARLDVNDPLEAARVALYVRGHDEGTPFHLAEWTAAVAAACRQPSRYLVAETAAGVIAGVLPLTLLRSRLFGTALVSAGFGVDGGVLADSPGVAASLAATAWEIATAEGAASLELRGGPVPGEGYHSDSATYLGFARALAADEAGELALIPRKQRAEVRKALAADFTVTIGASSRDHAAHYRVYAESVRNLGTPVFSRALFGQVLRRFGSSADIVTVWHGRNAVASVLSLYWNGAVYPYWGGGTERARALRANDAMYFALMNHARARGCTRFDFGRSKAGTGAAAFKKNWGFVGAPLAYHVRTADGAAPRSVNPLDPRYARRIALWKRLPLPVANLLGPMIARGLG